MKGNTYALECIVKFAARRFFKPVNCSLGQIPLRYLRKGSRHGKI